ncbi:unnamed protein product [Cyclocybe aegerita]|uniref:F-box domain-containing protein n=1 Tax=Cyclocybe aegerita TaxID=1973307 RepID=A0A8S0WL36_CYCAE|nr:unnamed protein product [Cyclocybe aegerita]
MSLSSRHFCIGLEMEPTREKNEAMPSGLFSKATSRQLISSSPYLPSRECRLANDTPCQPCRALQLHVGPQCNSMAHIEELRTLRSDVNQVHDPFVRHLPLEIACDIFAMCCLPDPDKPPYTKFEMSAPLMLGAVCRTWRRTVCATPCLWNVLFFDLWFEGCDTIARKELLAEWLLRSGRLPLHITIGTNKVIPEVEEEALFPLVDVLNAYADRWRTLKACAAFPGVLARLRGDPIPLGGEGILDLDLELHDADEMWPLVINLTSITPHLRKLRVHLVEIGSLKISYDFLTHLTAEYLNEDDCAEIMRCAPLLIVCKFRFMLESGGFEDAQQRVVVCHNLQKLVIEEHIHAQLASFFRRIQLPRLEELTISTSDRRVRHQILDLAAFFARSPCPLEALTLGDVESAAQDIRKMLAQVPTLKRLSLSARQESNWSVAYALYSLAGRFQPVTVDDHLEFYASLVPHLESLTCSANLKTFSYDILPKMFGIKAGQHGHTEIQASLRNLVLFLDDDKIDVMDRDTLLRCLRLCRAGVRIEINPDVLLDSALHHNISMDSDSILPSI